MVPVCPAGVLGPGIETGLLISNLCYTPALYSPGNTGEPATYVPPTGGFPTSITWGQPTISVSWDLPPDCTDSSPPCGGPFAIALDAITFDSSTGHYSVTPAMGATPCPASDITTGSCLDGLDWTNTDPGATAMLITLSSGVILSSGTEMMPAPTESGEVWTEGIVPITNGASPTAGFTWSGAGANSFNFVSSSAAEAPATIASYSWNFGDGETSTAGPNVTHTYASEAASRTVSLTVTDSNGLQATSTQTMGPDLTVSDAVSTPNTPDAGVPASLGVTIRNDGPATVTDVAPTVGFTEPSVAVGSVSPASADLAPGGSATFSVPFTGSEAGPIHAQIAANGTTGGNPVVASSVARVISVVGTFTATLTPSTTSPVAGTPFTLDLHVTNASGDLQGLSLSPATADPSPGVTITPPVNPPTSLADGTSADLLYTVAIAQSGPETFTIPLSGTDVSTSAVTNLTPGANVTAVPLAIVVNSTADDPLPPDAATANVCDVDPGTPGNQCTLRAALQLANLQTVGQLITFDIPGGGVPTIAPASALPVATVPVTIDGTTQSGGWVQLSGTGAPTESGLSITGGTSTVRGLVVNGWATGISLTGGGGDLVAGDRIGTDTTGTSAVPNNIGISLHAPTATIGATSSSTPGTCSGDCNVISGNTSAGVSSADVDLPLPARSQIVGNFVGTDVTGQSAIGNGIGIDLRANFPDQRAGLAAGDSVLVGGPTPVPGTAPGNVVSGNVQAGMAAGASIGTTFTMTVQGNLIGVTSGGTSALGNPIGVQDSSPGDTIGGNTAGAGNVVGGSTSRGIGSAGLVEGNLVGVSFTGAVLKNIVGVASVLSNATLCGNTVSGNTTGLVGDLRLDSGNRIGTDPTGSRAVPNQIGISPTALTSGVDSRCNDLGPDLISGNTLAGVEDPASGGRVHQRRADVCRHE